MGVKVPRIRHRQVILFRFTVDGMPCIDPGQPHGMGPGEAVSNLLPQAGLTLRGRSAVDIRDGARAALAALLNK
jgi:hypothetical protein